MYVTPEARTRCLYPCRVAAALLLDQVVSPVLCCTTMTTARL